MDREKKIATVVYYAVTAVITTAMLAGAFFVPQMPQSFFS